MARNEALQQLDVLLGRWELTLTDAWFLEPGTIQHGEATFEWLDDAFVVMRGDMEGERVWTFAFGYSDATSRYVALSHDPRGVARVFAMTFDGREWTLLREDPDFHQRLLATVDGDRIACRVEASEDEGRTWRKDFDLLYERRS